MYSHPLGYNWGGLAKSRWGQKRPLGPGHEGTSRRHRKYIASATQKERRATKELLGGIENIAPAAQKGSRVTIVAKHLHLPHKRS